ncbi:MAG TPA: hypothetical protein V6C72_08665 [Chroococcales cyanobacterium]
MKFELSVAVAAVVLTGLMAPAYADYSSVTTETTEPLSSEVRTTTVESTPTTVIHETAPVVVSPTPAVENNTTVIKDKRNHHHLLKLPFVSVF